MQDPLKQGLKQYNQKGNSKSICRIRMQDPLKQGLKPWFGSIPSTAQRYSNARSTKTRIETEKSRFLVSGVRYIRMQDPLKQGLKLFYADIAVSEDVIRMQDPLKQGLKLFFGIKYTCQIRIRMQDPLKQGLKPCPPPISI